MSYIKDRVQGVEGSGEYKGRGERAKRKKDLTSSAIPIPPQKLADVPLAGLRQE